MKQRGLTEPTQQLSGLDLGGNNRKLITYLFLLSTILPGCPSSSANEINPTTDKDSTELSVQSSPNRFKHSYPFSKSKDVQSLDSAIEPPMGYKRVQAKSEFGDWLSHLPIKPEEYDVHTFRGKIASLKQRFFMKNAGVVDMSILNRNQQCADSILRLRAEFLRSKRRKIRFKFGRGYKTFPARGSRRAFNRFLKRIYGCMGTASMKRDLKKVKPDNLRIGDMNVQNRTGSVGHIFLILDMAENNQGNRKYLLGQGSMPAQEFHIIEPLIQVSPWTDMDELQAGLQIASPHGKGVFRRF